MKHMSLSTLAFLWAIACLGGCANEPAPGAGTPDVVGEATADVEADTSADTFSPIDCPTGHVPGPDGECMAVGIQGCAEIFIDPESGLCEPKPEHCPLGQIPNFSDGCTPVGIQGCAEMFIEPETGLCDPKPEHCPPGQIPNFSEGCTPVGIPDCAEMFIDPESGLCDPDPDLCGEGFIPVSSQGCVSLDPPGGCGEGTWGNIEELPGDSHVDPNYSGGDSDGSREKPYTNTTTAYNKTADGGRMVLAAGDYDEGILISKSVSIIGRCSSMVTIGGVLDGALGKTVLEVTPYGQEVDITISDLGISGPGIGLSATQGAHVALSRMIFDGNRGCGICVGHSGTAVSATDILVTRTQPTSEGILGHGIQAEAGATLTLNRVAITKNHEAGLAALDAGTSLSAVDTLVTDMELAANGGASGVGAISVVALFGASLSLERCNLMDNVIVGLMASEAGTSVSVKDTLIARTQISPDGGVAANSGDLGGGATAVVALFGASLSLERCNLADNVILGLWISEPGTSVSVTDTLIARTQPWPNGTEGRGIEVDNGASLTLEGSAAVENLGNGLYASGAGTSVSVMDTLVARTQPAPNGTIARGIEVQDGASLTLERSVLVENHGIGLWAEEDGTSVTATDTLVARTQPTLDGRFGLGIQVGYGASLTLERSALVENHEVGLVASFAETSVTVMDSLIARTQPSPDGKWVRGIEVTNGASLTLEHSAVVENHGFGLVAMHNGTSVNITDTLITRTQPSADGVFGRGIHVQQDASLTLDHSAVVENRGAAVFISSSPIGSEVAVLYGSPPIGGEQLYSTTGSITNSLLADTLLNETWGFGEGLLVTSGAVVNAHGVIARGNARAGILHNNSAGALEGCLSAENQVGMVVQGLWTEPTTWDTNIFQGNEVNLILDGEFQIPHEAILIPASPEIPKSHE